MKRTLKKFIIITITLLLLLISIISINASVQASDNGTIVVNVKGDIIPGGNVAIEILLQDQKDAISAFSTYFNYDKNIFEDIDTSNLTVSVEDNKLESMVYEPETNKIVIYFLEDIPDIGTICTVNLKVKDSADLTTLSKVAFKLDTIETYSFDIDKTVIYEDVNKEITLGESGDGGESGDTEKLYLSSNKYKIGNNDINNYEDGDKYISRVENKTTKDKFISNLETNGTIRILKQDGTELGENELVGTGMILEVTKDEEKIELKIAVMGDLDGNGKVTVTDLSKMNQALLETITLENEYKIAGDLDENEKITVTDLSTLNKMLLEML